MILAIDPGSEQSAYVIWDKDRDNPLVNFYKQKNDELLEALKRHDFYCDSMVIEMVASYGMPVGKEIFDTCVWIGRFIEASKFPYRLIYRKDVKMYLCNSMRAKDSNIRQALIDRYGAVGTKKNPGKLYGVSKDIWSAVAVAVYASEVKE